MSDGALIIADGDTWADAESWEQMGTWVGPYAYTWSTPETWAEMPNWLGRQFSSQVTYIDTPIDLGKRLQFYALIDAETGDTHTIQVRHGMDGVTWSAWQDPELLIDARWLQVKVVVTSDEPDEPPILEDLTTVIVAKVVEKVYSDLRSIDVVPSLRYGVGDVRVATNAFLWIEAVNVTIRSPASPVSVVVVDKDQSGPRVKFFDPAGAPLDVTFDIRIRGY